MYVKVLRKLKSFIFASANIGKMLEVIVLSVIILFICLALLCVKIIFKKNGRFPHTHVGGNEDLQKKGIKCVQAQDFEAGTQINLFDRMSK